MKPRTLLFPLLLLCAGLARADKPDGDVVLREKLERIECAEFTAKASDGPALAAALQQTLRASPGGEAINVLWRPAEPALPKTPLEADLKGLRAHALLSAVCRRANLFWGLRNGMVVLDRAPLPGMAWIPYEPALVGPMLEDPSNTENGISPQPEAGTDAKLSAVLRGLLKDTEWREGETLSAFSEPAVALIMVTTSEEYLPALRHRLRTLNLIPRQVSITATWVAYPAAVVEKALAATPRTAFKQEDLMKLYTGSEKRILQTQTLIALSGVHGVTEATDEIIYPTEFELTDINLAIDPETQILKKQGLPGGFETRQIGGILNVIATSQPDSETINLVLLPEIAELAGWIQYGYEPKPPPEKLNIPGMHMPQPTFRSHNMTTTVAVRDGSTLALNGGRDPESGEYIYGYITAEMLDPAGKPLR